MAPHVADAMRVLRSPALFSGASERALERLAGIAHLRRYAPGRIVFRKGDPSDALLVVTAGRIAISSLSQQGAEVMLNLIDPGGVVGEIGVLDGGSRTADATATCETRALVLLRRDVLPILESEPSALRALVLLLCARLRQTTAFLEDAVLQTLAARLLHRIQALARRYGRALGSVELRIEHGLSQQALGDSIGASRVSVNSKRFGSGR